MKSLKLAWRYVSYHRLKTLLMILCIVLTILLPVALAILLGSFNRQIVSRARSTPLLVGAPGSRLDLAMHALYFRTAAPGTIALGQQKVVGDLGLAIPIHARITAGGVTVVGTTLDYFEFRNMNLASGNGLSRLGTVCWIRAARRLGKRPGDMLLTDRDNVFDFAGKYPLRMRITGVLLPRQTADDDVVFVDLKTAWVVEGLGHGHQDVANETDETLVLQSDNRSVTASAAVLPYTEITDENIGSFHFHGDFADFPVTALIVVPRDEKGEALLQGRFDRADSTAQMCQPIVVVEELMNLVFRVQRFFNANAILIAISTGLLLTLVVALSIRLREMEMQTMFKIGCSRGTMFGLVAAELFLVFACSTIVVVAAAMTIQYLVNDLVARLLVG